MVVTKEDAEIMADIINITSDVKRIMVVTKDDVEMMADITSENKRLRENIQVLTDENKLLREAYDEMKKVVDITKRIAPAGLVDAAIRMAREKKNV